MNMPRSAHLSELFIISWIAFCLFLLLLFGHLFYRAFISTNNHNLLTHLPRFDAVLAFELPCHPVPHPLDRTY